MDMSCTSDPYVVFSVGCRSKQSSVKRHSLNPVHPPESFELLAGDYELDELSVVVMDSDLLEADDTIGRVQIALAPVRRALQSADSWLLEGNCGSVTLELEWHGL
ncbi:Extended synaptotagmin-1 [Phytophthora pseudosyringae]|uniref:Extended synaptotagmin-1 n=1 Tax=Phytophthora pseudosyringae TaxID=221518 RepID=A0A8T1V6X6_9STRA|nr:Extended synaptotagmin-1 [Phytophthora pseudosyringae]